MPIEEMSSAAGKMSAAVMKNGAAKTRIDVVKRSGDMQIKSDSDLRSAEGWMSACALMKSANVKQPVFRRG
jgi:hypothetical protein